MGFFQACRLYPGAIGWSVFVSLGVVMLAFDPQLLGNLYATPQFQRDFGYQYNGDVCAQVSPSSPPWVNDSSTSSVPPGKRLCQSGIPSARSSAHSLPVIPWTDMAGSVPLVPVSH